MLNSIDPKIAELIGHMNPFIEEWLRRSVPEDENTIYSIIVSGSLLTVYTMRLLAFQDTRKNIVSNL